MATQFYTVSEVATMLRMTADHIYRVINSGELGSYKMGRRVLISQEQLNEWLASKRQYTKYERNVLAETYIATH